MKKHRKDTITIGLLPNLDITQCVISSCIQLYLQSLGLFIKGIVKQE